MKWLRTSATFKTVFYERADIKISDISSVMYDNDTGFISCLMFTGNIFITGICRPELENRIKLIDFQAKTLKELIIKLEIEGFVFDDDIAS